VVLGIVENDYIEAARASGTNDFMIIARHVLPNSMGPIIVQSTMSVARMILFAAGFSFIGLGIQPPAPEWGAMLADAREFLRRAPYLMIFPGISILLSSLSFNLLGDGLRDALDPKLKL
jgi:peptide/nickel transport system permease protein